VGVIVDGRAKGEGDAARGSRFNNPIRYLHDNRPHRDPGIQLGRRVDILPHCGREWTQAVVRAAVERYVDLVGGRASSAGVVYQAWNRVSELRSICLEEDCAAVNGASRAPSCRVPMTRGRCTSAYATSGLIPE